MTQIEEIDRREVMALDDPGFHCPHEARGRHRKIVAHHDHGLQLSAVALSQGVDKLGLLLGSTSVQPLLELIHHDHDLATVAVTTPAPQQRERLNQSQIVRQLRQPLAQPSQDSCFGIIRQLLRYRSATTDFAKWGSRPAFTSDDLPQPDGP